MRASRPLIVCTHCDTVHERVPVQGAGLARCVRCDTELYRHSRFSPREWQALVLAVFILFLIANLFPVVHLSMAGKTVAPTFPKALLLIWQQGYWGLSVMAGLVGFWLPLFQLIFQFWALGLIAREKPLPADFGVGLRALSHLEHWSMTAVLFLGLIVAIVKFAGIGHLTVAPGLYAFFALTFLLTGLSRITAGRLWRWAEDRDLVPIATRQDLKAYPAWSACTHCGFVQSSQNSRCGRCAAPVHKRKPNSRARVAALVLTACVFYIPANVLPVMELRSIMGTSAHTILGGVIQLWQLGSWDLALIVFIASIVVPITKLLALVILLIGRRWRGNEVQRQRNRIYDMVELIGQWSMLDVFVVVLMAALANFPGLSQIIPGAGALSFGIVVVLTMLAALSYDPRQGWDLDPREELLIEPRPKPSPPGTRATS
ncbi:paraquat-inducible protein A [Alcaligenes ammonioxydans]|uniref:paraquat-inducible protein A n=1 Tax=Alcaligenes ammonioxydans TaxID=2582914 RepID=UPI001E332509|nr:paraquat-inducible protein A [Alcaligenes ammonioxydans]HRK84865.1 paraquat-inducible protein A [Alcaligenes faecalis]